MNIRLSYGLNSSLEYSLHASDTVYGDSSKESFYEICIDYTEC